MPKAHDVATELRRIADALDKEPETELPQPLMSFRCTSYSSVDDGKGYFLAAVRLLPRPLDKTSDDATYEVGHGRGTDAPVWFRAYIDRSRICKLIEPAKPAVYECPSLLSPEEEAELEATGAKQS